MRSIKVNKLTFANRFGGRESFSDESDDVSEICFVVVTTNC